MKKPIIISNTSYIYLCDACGQKIEQDGKNIQLIQYPEPNRGDYAYHFHSSCLIEHLGKTFIAEKIDKK